jgi:hypothetical protein
MLPAHAGGYYETSEPKNHRQAIPGYFPDSVVTALDHFLGSVRCRGLLPHTRFI